nr:helix-turn-helix transcriptional regulator [Azospirillum soli]
MARILRGIKWFHRQVLLSHGLLVAASPLTAAERKVLHLFLTGLPEKLIAERLGRSQHTIHDTVASIYRKFGVSSRSALMAIWLGHPG